MDLESREDFRNDFEEFILYWDKEAEDVKKRELTEYDSQAIELNYANAMAKFSIYRNLNLFNFSDRRKLNLIQTKLKNSLAIARSNFRSNHRTKWERLIDSIGGVFHIFHFGNK